MNSGMAWAGKGRRQPDGSVLIAYGQPVNLGFSDPQNNPVAGPGDLIGWTPTVITADMVGKTVAVFTSIEAKPEGSGRTSKDQKLFAVAINNDGGIAGTARTPADVDAIYAGWFARMTKV